MCKGEVCINPWLVEEGKVSFRGKREVGVRDTQFSGREDTEGV